MEFDLFISAIITEQRSIVNQYLEAGFGVAFSHLPPLAQIKLRQMLQLPANFEMDYLLLCILTAEGYYYMTSVEEEVLLPLSSNTLITLCSLLESLPKVRNFEKAYSLSEMIKAHLHCRHATDQDWLKTA